MSTATQPGAVAHTLADIDALKPGQPENVVALWDYVAQLIVEYGDPASVLDQILDALCQAQLHDLLVKHGAHMLRADGANAAEVTETVLLPLDANRGELVLLVPADQSWPDTLDQARTLLARTEG